ncbi:unnamed protein product [Calypogeia fissa]
MFRPPPNHQPQGGPPRNNNLYPPQQATGASFVPLAFPMHGRGRGFHSPFHGGPPSYHPVSHSGPSPLVRPPPPPGSPPLETSPPPPPSDGSASFRSGPKSAPPPPPPMPKDPEMLKNIEILSSFVIKNGPQFESMARAKQAGDPKFAFLFGGERGSDAAFGYDFYNWKKEHLMWVEDRARGAALIVDQSQQSSRPSEPNLQGKNGGPVDGPAMSHDSPHSPTGSDMDMEDDFALPDPANEKHTNLDKSQAVPLTVSGRKSGGSPTSIERRVGLSSPAPEWKPDFSSSSHDTRPALSVGGSERKAPGHDSVDSKVGSQPDRDSIQGGNRLGAETQGVSHGGTASRATDMNRVQRETIALDAPRRRDSRRRTGFDRPCMEDVSPQSSPVRAQQQRESLPALDLYQKGTSGNGHREVPAKSSRWGPESSSEGRGSGFSASDKVVDANRGSKKVDTLIQKKGESSFTKDRLQSPDVGAKPRRSHDEGNLKEHEKLRPKSGADQPVDEFGRLLRQGDSDSDLEDDRYGWRKKRRRTSSRSRSRTPGDTRFKHRSPDHSPQGWGWRSRSWSRSPRRNKSRSITPPREGRWGGEGRGDRGGRRGGRGGRGPIHTCYDYLKGKCSRGSSCRFSHDDNHGGNGDQGGKSSGGRSRGRGREQGQTARTGEEVERNWGGKSGDDTKQSRPWESNERNSIEEREKKLIEDLKKQGHGPSIDEPLKRENGGPDNSAKAAGEAGRTGNYQQVVSSSERATNAHPPSSTAPLASLSQSSILPGPISQPDQQMSVLPTQFISQPVSALPLHSASETHTLGDLVSPVSQHSSLDGSPTPHSQQLQFSSTLTHLQQHSPSTALQSQKPGQQPFPTLSQINNFASNALHQQFSTARSSLSGSSPPLQVLQPPFAAVSRPQTSFGVSPQPNFAQFSNNNGQGNVQFRPLMAGGQPQMLRSPTPQPLHSRPMLTWIPGPAPSFSVGLSQPLQQPPHSLHMPLQPVQRPPHSLQIPIQPLQQPPHSLHMTLQPPQQPPYSLPMPIQPLQQLSHSLQQSSQPLQQPPLQQLSQSFQQLSQPLHQPPSQQVSTTAAAVSSYPLSSSYAMPSYSTVTSNEVPSRARPSTKEQYDPLADSLEPAPPGSAGKKGVGSKSQSLSQNPGGMTAPLMTNAGEVVLENVSPGLPSHVETVGRGSGTMGKVSPVPQPQMVMENVSPTDLGNSMKVKAPMKSGGPQGREAMENVSPPNDNPQEGGDGGNDSAFKWKENKKKDEGRVLNLIRKAVTEQVKDALKPSWKGGHITKEAFKTIAKKAVDKVMGALELKGAIPKTQEKVDSFMTTSKPKIAKLVQGYVDKYSK